MPKLIDNLYAARFATLLYMDWSKWDAYKQGVIDASGTVVKEPKTPSETKSWTYLHRLAANIKKLIETVPGGKSKIGKLVATYALFREDSTDEIIYETFDPNVWLSSVEMIQESYQFPEFREFVKCDNL